jgi:hypothetical protein
VSIIPGAASTRLHERCQDTFTAPGPMRTEHQSAVSVLYRIPGRCAIDDRLPNDGQVTINHAAMSCTFGVNSNHWFLSLSLFLACISRSANRSQRPTIARRGSSLGRVRRSMRHSHTMQWRLLSCAGVRLLIVPQSPRRWYADGTRQ